MPESPFRHELPDDSPGFVLWRLTLLWQERIANTLRPFGLSQTQYAILASLSWYQEQHGQPTQRHLGDHAKIEKMTLSKAIRRLESLGLVTRQSSPRDARVIEVALTEDGRDTTLRAVLAVELADNQFFSELDAPALQTWLDLSLTVIAAPHEFPQRSDQSLVLGAAEGCE